MEGCVRTYTLLLLAATAITADTPPRPYTEVPEIAHGQTVLWHDPGAVEQLDFKYGTGGAALAPAPPFSFEKEDLSGTSPKVRVKDSNGRTWVIKFGHEA